MYLFSFTERFSKNFKPIGLSIFFLVIIAKIVLDSLTDNILFMLSSMLVSLTNTVYFNLGNIPIFILNFVYVIIFVIRIAYINYTENNELIIDSSEDITDFYVVIVTSILICIIFFLNQLSLYNIDKLYRKSFLANESVKLNRAETDDILSILVPKFV